MKKLLIIITLFVSSFFFISLKEAKAATEFTVDVDSSYFENNKELLSSAALLRDLAENHIKNSDYSYYLVSISATTNKSDISSLRVFFFKDVSTFSYVKQGLYHQYKIDFSVYYLGDNNELIFKNDNTAINIYLSSTQAYIYIYYSNFDIPIFKDFFITYNFTDFTYTDSFDSTGKITPILEIYNNYYNIEEENPHQEEIDKVTNFYTLVIEKIEYLANEISNNYILLFVIGIFIVTFVFLLIFRRFL